jgi:radical SAM protein with 4Fe4S-binding SPASM domain
MMTETLNLGIDLSIITNGHLLTGQRAEVLGHAKWVRVSIDYNSPEQFAANRRITADGYHRIYANLTEFSHSKQPGCELEVNYIVHNGNCDGLVDTAARLKAAGVQNVRFCPMWIVGFYEYHAPIRERVQAQIDEAAAKLNDSTFSINSTYNMSGCGFSLDRGYTHCHFGQIVPVVGADQNVYACHNKAYDSTGLIGSIKDQKFEQLWMGGQAEAFFKALNPSVTCRHQCSNCEKNRIINSIIACKGDNFV